MGCTGVICPYKKKNVSLIECSICEGCKAHGAEHEDFPLILRKKYLFPQFRSNSITSSDISVTKICGCLRKHYFEITSDFYMKIDSFKSLNFGTTIHNHLGDADIWHLKESRMSWSTPKGNSLIGYFDIININDRVLYDLKTTGYGQFKKKNNTPNEHDVLQVTIYATMLKKLAGIELRGIKLLYIGLGDKVTVEFDVPFIDRTDFINNQTDFLSGCISKRQPPKGEPLAAWECGLCPFAEGCPDKISKIEEKLLKAKLAEDFGEEL